MDVFFAPFLRCAGGAHRFFAVATTPRRIAQAPAALPCLSQASHAHRAARRGGGGDAWPAQPGEMPYSIGTRTIADNTACSHVRR